MEVLRVLREADEKLRGFPAWKGLGTKDSAFLEQVLATARQDVVNGWDVWLQDHADGEKRLGAVAEGALAWSEA